MQYLTILDCVITALDCNKDILAEAVLLIHYNNLMEFTQCKPKASLMYTCIFQQMMNFSVDIGLCHILYSIHL